MPKPPFEVVFYEDTAGKKPGLDWIRKLTAVKKRAAGAAMEQVLQHQGVGVCDDGSWGKQLGDGVFEFRVMRVVNWSVTQRGKKVKKSEKVSLRIFCHAYGQKKILVLSGYDKGRHPESSRQQKEIEKAKRFQRDWKERQQSTKKAGKAKPKTGSRPEKRRP